MNVLCPVVLIMFKKIIVARSDEITTCFFMSESSDDELTDMYKQYTRGVELDAIIWDAVGKVYEQQDLY
jgi:hypothetical protein